MTADRLLFIGFPTLLSLLLHIVVASLLFLRWSGPTEVVASVPVALPIQATIVRTETAKAASKPKPKAKPEPKPKSAEIPTTKPEPPPVAVTPQPKAADPTPAEEIALQMDAEQLAALTREELTSLIDAEQAASWIARALSPRRGGSDYSGGSDQSMDPAPLVPVTAWFQYCRYN
jgi:outer membrane biosynthesis protein TonB